jgi:hypothetical protein
MRASAQQKYIPVRMAKLSLHTYILLKKSPKGIGLDNLSWDFVNNSILLFVFCGTKKSKEKKKERKKMILPGVQNPLPNTFACHQRNT